MKKGYGLSQQIEEYAQIEGHNVLFKFFEDGLDPKYMKLKLTKVMAN